MSICYNEMMEKYRESARERERVQRQKYEQRRARAWEVARAAAALLKEEFAAERVVVFGSLVRPVIFHWRSDVDLAVWGLPESDYLRALSELLYLDPQISVDLVEMEYAPPSLRERIQEEGIEL